MASNVIRKLLAGVYASASDFLRDSRQERIDAESGLFETRFFEIPSDTDAFSAPARLSVVDPAYFTSERYLRTYERADWQNTHRAIQEFAARLVIEARRRRVPLFVHCAFRTPHEQAALKSAGRSRALHPDAPHVRGGAVDIVHASFAWDMSHQEWAFIGKLGKEIAARMGIEVEWGGDWSFYDPAHWQLRNWRMCTSAAIPDVGPPLRMSPLKIKGAGWSFVSGRSKPK